MNSMPWNSWCGGERQAGNHVVLETAKRIEYSGFCSRRNEEIKLGGAKSGRGLSKWPGES